MSPANQTLLARFSVAISIFALVMVGVVAVRGDGGGGSSEAAAAAPVAVALSEFAIAPSTVTVPVGGKLQLSNNGSVDHNVHVLDSVLRHLAPELGWR